MPWTGPHQQPDCPNCSDDFIGLVGSHCPHCKMEGRLEEDEDEDLSSCDWCGELNDPDDLVGHGDATVCKDCADGADYEDQVRGDYRSMQL